MDVTVIKGSGAKHRAVIVRADGSRARFTISDYGSALPHDLAHLVVEDVLGLSFGFYGLLARGANLQALQVAGARKPRTIGATTEPLVEVHAAELIEAESLVNALSGPHRDPEAPVAIADEHRAAIDRRLVELNETWQAMAPGERLHFTWDEGSSLPKRASCSILDAALGDPAT